jgi:hypothetical protein
MGARMYFSKLEDNTNLGRVSILINHALTERVTTAFFPVTKISSSIIFMLLILCLGTSIYNQKSHVAPNLTLGLA